MRRPCKTEAEARVVQPQAKGHLEPPEAGRGRKHPPLELSEGIWPRLHLDFRLPASRTGRRVHFCCFKPLNLWYFVTADTGNFPH